MSMVVHFTCDIFIMVIIMHSMKTCWSVYCTKEEGSQLNECIRGMHLFGPGWHQPELILPSRYFFIQVPQNCDKSIFNITIQPNTGHRDCPLKQQVLHETVLDLIIVRYRLLSLYCHNGFHVSVSIKETGEIVASKHVDQDINSEECYCPNPDFDRNMGCSADLNNSRIDQDLSPFRSKVPSDFNVWLNEAIKRFAGYPRSYSFCHYKIISNEIYRKCYGEYVGFTMFFDEFLKSLLRKCTLPDTQFLLNLGDWPLSSRKDSLMPLPFFSWCGSSDTYDLVMPTYEMTESVMQAQVRVSVDVLSLLGKQAVAFVNKTQKVFFRGRDSNRIRLLLVLYSKKTPELLDAAITNFFFFRDAEDMEKYGPKVDHTSIFDFFQNKYLINIDGTVAAYRLPYLLSGSSLILKQKSKYFEHFYHLLESWEHLIELKEDLTDFYDVVDRLINSSRHDFIPISNQLKMIYQANQLTLRHLLPTNIYCYYYNLIIEYSKLLPKETAVKISEEDEHVVNSHHDCSCGTTNKSRIKGEL